MGLASRFSVVFTYFLCGFLCAVLITKGGVPPHLCQYSSEYV